MKSNFLRKGKTNYLVLTFILFSFFLFSLFLVSGLDVSDDSQENDVKGVNIIIPETPINYSLIPTVNSSDYWDDLDTPADILGSSINNDLGWITSYVDTNATTECGDTELLRGDGVCIDTSTFDQFGDIFVNESGDTMTGNLTLNDDVALHFGTDKDFDILYPFTAKLSIRNKQSLGVEILQKDSTPTSGMNLFLVGDEVDNVNLPTTGYTNHKDYLYTNTGSYGGGNYYNYNNVFTNRQYFNNPTVSVATNYNQLSQLTASGTHSGTCTFALTENNYGDDLFLTRSGTSNVTGGMIGIQVYNRGRRTVVSDSSTWTGSKVQNYQTYGHQMSVTDSGSTTGSPKTKLIYGHHINMIISGSSNKSAYGIYLTGISSVGSGEAYGIFDQSGEDWAMDSDNSKFYLGADQDAWQTWDGTNYNFNQTGNGRWTFWNSTGLGEIRYGTAITSTTINNKTGVLEEFNLGNELYNPDGSINHSAFGDCYRQIEETDTNNCWEVIERTEYCYNITADSGITDYSCMDEQINNWKQYNQINSEDIIEHKRTECGTKLVDAVDLTCEQAQQRQALALVNQNVDIHENLTDFDTDIMAEEIYTQSKVINPNINYKDIFKNRDDLDEKTEHYAYVSNIKDTGKDGLSVEDRIVALEGMVNEMAQTLCSLGRNEYCITGVIKP